MTEQLANSVESMSLEPRPIDTEPLDYQCMLTMELFKIIQIEKIKKSREGFEQRIASESRTIKDFVEYIKYERSLLGIIKERMKQHNIKFTSDHELITMISDRIKEIYTKALTIFAQNLRFWDEYIKFLQTFKNKADVSAAFERMLEFHGDNVDVWLRAILWEYNENYNDERVRSLWLRAQEKLPDAYKLYVTGFRIELENKCKLDETEAIQRAKEMYANSRAQKFTNTEFYIELLEILDTFIYAYSIEQHILNDMHENCPHAEMRWHRLAQRALSARSANNTTINCPVDFSGLIKLECDAERNDDGKIIDTNQLNLNLKMLKIENLSTTPHHTLAKRIESCANIYEDAVKDINSAKMWKYYISTMVELNKDLSTNSKTKQLALLKAFAGAFQFNHLTEENYIQYIEILYQSNRNADDIEAVFRKATKMYQRSLRIWVLCMRFYIQQENAKKVRETFKISKDLLGKNGVEIWELYMLFVKTFGDPQAKKEFEQFIADLSRQHYPAFDKLKCDVLSLVAMNGIQMLYATYNLFTADYPNCNELLAIKTHIESAKISR